MFYVYLYLDPKTFDTFYVGKGSEQRWKICNHTHGDNKWLINKMHKVGLDKILIKTINCASEGHALQLEKEIIQQFGRKDSGLGTLLNMTNGGDGVSGYKWTEEQKQLKSEEVKAYFTKNDNPFKGKKHSESAKERMSLSKRGQGNWCTILTEEIVKSIRLDFSKTKLSNSQFSKSKAKTYNVSVSTINDVIFNRSWKYII